MKANAELEACVATLRQELAGAHEAHATARAAYEQEATATANVHAQALDKLREALRVAAAEAENSQQGEQRRRVVDGAALAAVQAALEIAREENAFDTATIASLRADLALEATKHAEALDSSLFWHLEDVQALKEAHDAAMEAERQRAEEQARAAEEAHRVELAELEDLHQTRLALERSTAASRIAKEATQAQERVQKVVLTRLLYRVGKEAPLTTAWLAWQRYTKRAALHALAQSHAAERNRASEGHAARLEEELALHENSVKELESKISSSVTEIEARERAEALRMLEAAQSEAQKAMSAAQIARDEERSLESSSRAAEINAILEAQRNAEEAAAQAVAQANDNARACTMRYMLRRIGYGAPLASAWLLWVRQARAISAASQIANYQDILNHQHRLAVARTLKHVIQRFLYGLLSVSWRQWAQQTRTAATKAMVDLHERKRLQDHQSAAVDTLHRSIYRCLHVVPLLAAWRSWNRAVVSIKTSSALTSAMLEETRKEHAKMAVRMVKRAAHRFKCQSCVSAAWHTWVRYVWAQRVVEDLATRYTRESELAAAAAVSEATTAAEAAKDANTEELSALHAMEMAAQRARFDASLLDGQADHAAVSFTLFILSFLRFFVVSPGYFSLLPYVSISILPYPQNSPLCFNISQALALVEAQADAAADAQSELHARKIAEIESAAQAQIAAARKAKADEEKAAEALAAEQNAARDAATIEALKQELHALENQVRHSATGPSSGRTTSMGAKVPRAAAAAAAEAATAASAAERGRLAIVEKKRAALVEEKHAQQVRNKVPL